MDTGQKTESILQLVQDIERQSVALPEFQRDFVWELEKTFDLFDSFVKEIFIGSLIYGVPSFEISTREIDGRPRKGAGSRAKLKINSYDKAKIEALVKTQGFRLLLDGQQRATSIYRAVRGIDPLYFIARLDAEMSPEHLAIPPSKRTLEQSLLEFSDAPQLGHVAISLNDVFRVVLGEAPRDKDKVELFLKSALISGLNRDNAEETEEFTTFLTQLRNLEVLFRQEKLVAYYLLDTDEEKFALFFERSNSKGMQLNFIDILAAKLYVGFNLRQAIEDYATKHPQFPLHREVLVRSIGFVASGGKDIGRAYILSTLNHAHFTEHWSPFVEIYNRTFEFLLNSRLLIHPQWIPYDNLVIPIMAFLRQISHRDFSQMTELQAQVLESWYWLAIFSRRYSSAAQTYLIEDAQALESAGRGDFAAITKLLEKLNPAISSGADLLTVNKKYDALYKGVMNLVHYENGGFVGFENNKEVSWSSELEDHHIFPRDYLRQREDTEFADLDRDIVIDCVVNRTLIPKLTNVKASNKAPSVYLKEIAKNNVNLAASLARHMLPAELIEGVYDELYGLFLDERSSWIYEMIIGKIVKPREALVAKLKEILVSEHLS